MSAIAEQIVAPLKKVVSDKQMAANKANAQKSTGPRTAQGKASSRRNAVKGGLTGDGIVMPEDLEAEVQAEITIFAARFQPTDDYEHRLIRQAAVGSVRFDRLQKAQDARLALHRTTATRTWDETRAAEVLELADLLMDDPAEATRRLQRTAEGCDYLWDAWDDLKTRLDDVGEWDDDKLAFALRLLGWSTLPNVLDNDPAAILAGVALGVRDDRSAFARFLELTPDQLDTHAPLFEDCQTRLTDIIVEEMDRLRTLADQLWDRYDAPDRAGASQRAWVDTSLEGQRLYRYDRDATRLIDRSLRELETRRKADDLHPAPTKTAARQIEPKPAAPTKSNWKGAPGAEGYQKMAQDALAQNKPILASLFSAIGARYIPDHEPDLTLESPV
ncbi:MAG: hypothetical protein ABI353_12160 [Isosphaeraceae bacterium]